jgi:transcriptional regulator with XRE-family HTH domain
MQSFVARTALGWNLRQLGRAAKVSAHTIARFECGYSLKATTVEAIQAMLEKAGVVFRKRRRARSEVAEVAAPPL